MYKKRSGKELNDNTAREAMALIVLAEAINRAGTTKGPELRAALAATDIPGEQTIMPWIGSSSMRTVRTRRSIRS